jgi:hypothetical protein
LKGKPWTGLDQKVDEQVEHTDNEKKMSPREAYDELVDLFSGKKDIEPNKELLDIIATDAESSFNYAVANPAGRFQLGEPAIAESPKYSYMYAKHVLKGPFNMGEPAIVTDPELSFEYAKNVLKGRFKRGESIIATNGNLSFEYAKFILKAMEQKKTKK